ncbi:uncharacterized protein LACBIDRAFT_331755 [Laccaria bicolor S238N-H82]|nr:uncharacterized protein LACBIDRAFT_324493 [Laccaria bicolor S238N-H82]XP_001886175.1 uncharacterized protein LACBIDRAFT_331755 [Laccaria bicolor S238N-H82]EDR03034.1 predicted protein [Laccaria bicolor S238N-H82]EDR11731.1 predicted protein [Laccaria bicolor S238N-H82]|eukprot:XP_001877628.1 predicted protein [Laccaria bicolor S238N-H82]
MPQFSPYPQSDMLRDFGITEEQPVFDYNVREIEASQASHDPPFVRFVKCIFYGTDCTKPFLVKVPYHVGMHNQQTVSSLDTSYWLPQGASGAMVVFTPKVYEICSPPQEDSEGESVSSQDEANVERLYSIIYSPQPREGVPHGLRVNQLVHSFEEDLADDCLGNMLIASRRFNDSLWDTSENDISRANVVLISAVDSDEFVELDWQTVLGEVDIS